LNESQKLNSPVVKFGFNLVFAASELIDAGVVGNLDEAVRAGDVSVEHEDHIDSVRVDLFGIGVPEHTGVVGLALLE
jgi:hypothetical protein